ncbi:hypothetical protein BT93_G1532 [Corymbia citriodora subsp. variegata]|nr:hypothetical protein BT93_G1532 [Corymbia citriodora subsp. variegata]
MERDFLGLSSGEPPAGVVKKEEISSEACRDSGLNKVSGTRWPLLEKLRAVPHLKLELPGGGLVSKPNSGLPGDASTLGTTEPSSCRNGAKPYGPPQLTIFYAGTVNVYNDIPPEKVQAIMFLAGHGTSKSPKASHSKCYVHTPTRPCSGLSSPFSAISLPAPHLRIGPLNTNEPKEGNPEGITAPSKVDSPKMVGAMRSPMISTAMPQPPKASLARFLEKRKERLRNAAPYNLDKSSSLERATPDSSPVKLSSGPAMDTDCTL